MLTEEFISRYTSELGEQVTGDAVHIYRALKGLALPLSEARKLVASVKDDDDFKAWHRLHRRFEPELEAKQGIVLAERGELVNPPPREESRRHPSANYGVGFFQTQKKFVTVANGVCNSGKRRSRSCSQRSLNTVHFSQRL